MTKVFTVDNVTTYKRLHTRRDVAKWFFRFVYDIIDLKAHVTFIAMRNDKDEIVIHYGTTPPTEKTEV